MKTATRKANVSTESDGMISGLCLSGTICKRTKRIVPVDNPTTEIVTYVVADNNERYYYVDDYSPTESLILQNPCKIFSFNF